MKYWAILGLFGSSLSGIDSDQILDHFLKTKTQYIFEREGNALLLSGGAQTRAYPFGDIVVPGMYKLSSTVNRKITITVDNVSLDLNGNTVTGGIEVSSGLSNITIKNGQVDVFGGSVSDAIKINSGCSKIMIDQVVAKNALASGVAFDQATDSFITNCDFTQNGTGLSCNLCANIVVKNCTAIKNSVEGYTLVSSSTCSFNNCQAQSTGDGNLEASDLLVAGFDSKNGYGNIFNNCIANSTQALEATDSNSVIAGFLFRGNESCSCMEGCTASNSQTNPYGVTIPYGILLENNLSMLETFVQEIPQPNKNSQAYWSPDQRYILVPHQLFGTGNTTPGFDIYAFDAQSDISKLTKVAQSNDVVGSLFADWHPDGRYLAVVSTSLTDAVLRVYYFNPINNTITLAAIPEGANLPDANAGSVEWSPDGRYIAVGLATGSSEELVIYNFDVIGQSLIKVATPSVSPMAALAAVAWSKDGKYVFAGSDTGALVTVYLFENNTLTFSSSNSVSANVRDFSLSFDNRYLAVGMRSDDLAIYEFDSGVLSLVTSIGSVPGEGTLVEGVNWSADGHFLAVIKFGSTSLSVYEFDRGNQILNPIITATGVADTGLSLKWSPDGSYLAAGYRNTEGFVIYNALTFPSKNLIKNNTIYGNSGGFIPLGIGISGSSILNMIIGNTCYNNAINPWTVYTNYAFCTNVFNELFNNAPSELQNISLGGYVPIATPANEKLLFISNAAKACDIQTKVNQLILNVA